MGILQTAGGGGGALAVSSSNASGSNGGFIGCGNPGSTGLPGAAVAGGSGNYTFKWTRLSGTTTYGPWVCSNTAVLNPTWHAPDPVCANAPSSAEVWQIEVTDNQSGQIGRATSVVTIIWIDTR